MDIKAVSDQLSNFYKDYSGNPETMNRFFEIFAGAVDVGCSYMKGIKRNSILSTIETYRKVPYFAMNISSISYSLTSLLANPYTEKGLGLTRSTLSSRIEHWNATATVDQKVTILDQAWLYCTLRLDLEDDVQDEGQKIYGSDGVIIDLKVETVGGIVLHPEKDYVLRDHRFYLLNDIGKIDDAKDMIVLKDILIDYNISYNRLGLFLNAPYQNIISKPEYTAINKVFLQAALKGSTIKNIKEAIAAAFGWKSAQVYDMESNLTAVQQAYWTSGAYSPYHFIISMPVEYYSDSAKIAMLDFYLSVITPAYTKHVIQWSDLAFETMGIAETQSFKLTHPPVNDTMILRDAVVPKAYALVEKIETVIYQELSGTVIPYHL